MEYRACGSLFSGPLWYRPLCKIHYWIKGCTFLSSFVSLLSKQFPALTSLLVSLGPLAEWKCRASSHQGCVPSVTKWARGTVWNARPSAAPSGTWSRERGAGSWFAAQQKGACSAWSLGPGSDFRTASPLCFAEVTEQVPLIWRPEAKSITKPLSWELAVCCAPGTVLRTLHPLSHLTWIFLRALWDRSCYYPCFSNEEAQA